MMAVDARERLTHGAGILISRRHSWTTLWITREKTSGYDYDTLTAASRRRLRDIDGFLSEMRGMGRTVLDVRRNGDVLVPIMALMPGFPLAQASAFAAHISGIILREVRTDASEGGVEHE